MVVEDITQTSVTISWKRPLQNGGSDITAYIIERRDRRYTSWTKVDRVKPSIHSYCVQNLVEGNEYFIRVFAENSEGVSEGALVSAEAIIPCRKAGLIC